MQYKCNIEVPQNEELQNACLSIFATYNHECIILGTEKEKYNFYTAEVK